ncbi:MAG: carbohydrate porin [Xanthomonadales bacterium]|nr:carbohydrate porin [Xanthomonadales bacterium]
MILKKFVGLRLSALSLGCLLAMPGIAMADEAKEQALEQRINDLEKQLQQLAQEIRAQREAAPAAAPALPAGKLPIQLTTLTPGSPTGTTVKIGGFVKADFMATKAHDGYLADGASGRILYVPGQTPVGGSSSDTVYDAHAKFSRFNIGIDTVSDAGDKSGAFLEMDFFGNALGNQTSTNTYGVTVRHAYAYWNHWLAGQTWSNFMDVSALPDAVDFIGPTDGVIFSRQAQIRYSNGGFSAALENPETTLIPNGGGGAIVSDRGALPDLTLRYGWKGDWGTFGVGALLRSLDIDRAASGTTPAASDSEGAFAFTVGGKWVLGKHDDLRYQVTAGDGMSRYIGLAVTGDAAISADGNLDAIGGFAGYLAWRHAWSSQLRSNLIFARSQYDNPIDLTGTGVNKSVQSFRVNLFYSPMPKLDVGVELMRANRELESGVDGALTRLQFTTKYSF